MAKSNLKCFNWINCDKLLVEAFWQELRESKQSQLQSLSWFELTSNSNQYSLNVLIALNTTQFFIQIEAILCSNFIFTQSLHPLYYEQMRCEWLWKHWLISKLESCGKKLYLLNRKIYECRKIDVRIGLLIAPLPAASVSWLLHLELSKSRTQGL
jgi:hypothetical protein